MLNNYDAGRDGSGRVESDKVVKMIADFAGRSGSREVISNFRFQI